MWTFNGKFDIHGDVKCSDKSLTHRAFVAAAIADGVSTLHGVTLSDDVLATVRALEVVAQIDFDGVSTESGGITATVTPRRRKLPAEVTIDCANSGTTARLLAGLFVGLGINARFVGDESLTRRPMERVTEPLRRLGADIQSVPDCLFVTRGGTLCGTDIVAEVDSAQVKSAVILAGLFAEGTTRYTERLPTRNHTENLLRALGADVTMDGKTVSVQKSRPHAFDIYLPTDPSAVAYPLALALLSGRKAMFGNVLLNERRMGFFRVLQRAGARVEFKNLRDVLGEKVGDIEVLPSVLRPFKANVQDVCDGVDEIPLLAAVALFVEGTHVFCGVKELANKESNRIDAICHIATVCGQRCTFDGNNLVLTTDGNVPKGKFFCSFGDHRIAMTETVLCIATGSGSVDSAPYGVSHPYFLNCLGVTPLKFGLVGTRTLDSPSPTLHAHLAMQAGVCCTYKSVVLPHNVSDDELIDTIRGFDGANVTMPFKARVARLFQSPLSSVNTVIHGKDCASTDGYGVVQSLHAHGVTFEGQKLWIVGAGGAAEAAICELLRFGCKLRVINRTPEHGMRLQQKYALPDDLDDPVGVLSFVPSCEFERGIELPASCRFVLIADYRGASGLKARAAERGLTVIDGLEMLYHQGAKSFALWTGTPLQNDYAHFVADL